MSKDYIDNAHYEFSRGKNEYMRITIVKEGKPGHWFNISPSDQKRLVDFINKEVAKPIPVLGQSTPEKENFMRGRFSLVGELLGLLGVVMIVLLVGVALFGRVSYPSGGVVHEGKFVSDKPALQLFFPVKQNQNGNND